MKALTMKVWFFEFSNTYIDFVASFVSLFFSFEITEAFVSKNNTNTGATTEHETTTNITDIAAERSDLQSDVNCNCSKTIALNQSQIYCPSNNASDKAGTICSSAVETHDDNNKKQNNESTSTNDTVMKYVYKKGETTNIEKKKGHYKNSLRKQRSVDSQNDQTAPLIVNYETLHAPVQDREQWLPAKITANVIADANLANFNIETLHDNENVNNSRNEEIQSDHNDGSEENRSEHKDIQIDIKENDDHLKETENNDQDKDSSEEKEQLSKDKSQEEVNSNESAPQSSEENSRENDHRKYANKENDDRSKETVINDHLDAKIAAIHSESEESEPRDKEIQDVDLNDFGYERIQLDKKGQVESVSEPEESEETTHPNNESQYKTKDESNEKSDSSSKETNAPTHINDGEVKPVVEHNSEVDSFEFNEPNPDTKIENESLEELTGVKDDISENNDRLQEVKEPGDIKQQFERVPLNYKHGNGNQEANDKEGQDSEGKNDVSEIGDPKGVKYDENLNIKFGDLDLKLPEIKLPDDVISYAYEDSPIYKTKEKPKKNFYIYKSAEEEDTDHEDEENDNEHDTDDSAENNDYHNDADDSYYDSYRKKQPYKKHKNEKKKAEEEDEDEDEDPYEKFVRERFGKRGNFEKRSQKLRNFEPHDPELYKTVQKVIEKTKNLNKEAAMSEDPNAGYMWTLEYGQKL